MIRDVDRLKRVQSDYWDQLKSAHSKLDHRAHRSTAKKTGHCDYCSRWIRTQL